MGVNVKTVVDEKAKTLTIVVDLTKTFGPSKTGNTIRIASTEGNVKLPEPFSHISVGLSVYTKDGIAPKK